MTAPCEKAPWVTEMRAELIHNFDCIWPNGVLSTLFFSELSLLIFSTGF